MAGISPFLAGIPSTTIKTDPIPMGGGLDITTPPFSLKPGFCRLAQNFEATLQGGYRRIDGYERFDGRAKPSDATYSILNATSITGGAAGDTLTGATSGATGVILTRTATYFVLTATSGTYQAAENLQVGGVTKGVSGGAAMASSASSALLAAQYKNLAADVYRALIQKVPGSGSILGVAWLANVLYAWRNNVGATAAAIYKSTTSGWSLIALGRELAFTSGGTYVLAEGDVITGATSAATATVTRVGLQSGSYAGGDAAGRLVFATQTGTFQAENLNVGANMNVATIAGNSSAITLQPSGRYDMVVDNFTGSTNTRRIYGADGVNRGFEFDGTVYMPISTGMTTDTPLHVAVHLKHLFFTFRGSLQSSGLGLPYQWTPLTGANEIGMGDTITGLISLPAGTDSSTLAVFTVNALSILYGSSNSDWALRSYRDKIGAAAYTMQLLADTMFLDAQGITNLTTTLAYGNFAHAAISNAVRSMINGWRNAAVASNVCRDTSQYRIYFSNKYALYITVAGKKIVGIMPQLYVHAVTCAVTDQDSNKNEVMFFGTSDGYVMQQNKGTSLDGDPIEAFMNLAYNFSRSARVNKLYRDGVLEIQGTGYAQFAFGAALGYSAANVIQPLDQILTVNFSSVFWDSFTWDNFVWDGITLGPSSLELGGEAENISFAIRSNADYYDSFTVTGGLMHFSPRRQLR